DIASTRGETVPETALWLLRRAGVDFYCATIVERWTDWTDLLSAMQDPNFLIMGDGASGGVDGPLCGFAFSLSDWAYAPAMLGHFVRDLKAVSLESAIRRMTSLPADQLGLHQRGRVVEGYFADLVVFDPSTVGSDVTPGRLVRRPTGIDHVLVNGQFVVR